MLYSRTLVIVLYERVALIQALAPGRFREVFTISHGWQMPLSMLCTSLVQTYSSSGPKMATLLIREHSADIIV
jgi:hypothetical protein